MELNKRHIAYVVTGLLILSGCAPSGGAVQPEQLRATLTKDMTHVYANKPQGKALKLEDALAQALKYNLDTKVAEMDELIGADDVTLQQLSALPSVTAKMQRVGRNNSGGSSSFSVLTGTQSLQPSISTDQYRNLATLSVEWDLLDAGMNLARAKSASDKVLIAQERRRKVYQGVLQDTYSAYWRVAVAQSSIPVIDQLMEESQKRLNTLEEEAKAGIKPVGDIQAAKTALRDRRQRLMGMKQALALSETELKTLINYPIDAPIALDLEGQNWLRTGRLPVVTTARDDLMDTALMNRPEIREEMLNKRISARDIKMSVFETFPGAEMLFTHNYDSNSFLVYHNWVDGIIGLTQSINKIFTLPARLNRAKNMDQLADKRRQALVAAVMTQVQVAKTRYDFLSDVYRESAKSSKNSYDTLQRARDYRQSGLSSGAQLLDTQIDSGIAAINRAFAYADAQDAYVRFVNSLGIDLWDANDKGLSVPELARQIKKNLSDERLFVSAYHPGKTAVQ